MRDRDYPTLHLDTNLKFVNGVSFISDTNSDLCHIFLLESK